MHTKELGVVFWNVPSDILRVPEIVCFYMSMPIYLRYMNEQSGIPFAKMGRLTRQFCIYHHARQGTVLVSLPMGHLLVM